MNILFIAREIPYPVNSGVRMRTWNVLKRLSDVHDVHIIVYGDKEKEVADEVNAVCSSVTKIKPLSPSKGFNLLFKMFAGLFSSIPYIVSSRYSREFRERTEALVSEKNIDLVVCDSLFVALNSEGLKVRKILNEHNIESIIIKRYAELEKNIFVKMYALYEMKRMQNFENRIWMGFEKCFVCSEVDRQEVISRTGHKDIVVIPNGIDINVTNDENIEEIPGNLVYTGLISWKPNEDAVVYFAREIYPLIRKEVPSVTFSIVGKGPKRIVQALAEKDSSIDATGFVDDIRKYIYRSDVFIVPLRIGSGTRLKILEAMSMNKAIVSTTIGAEGLDVKDGENILIADEPDDFKDKVVSLLRDKELKEKLKRNGRKLVEEKYSWEVIGSMIKEEVEKL